MKWKCHNCGNIFESKNGLEKEEFEFHIYDCMNSDDFFEVLNNDAP